MPHPPTLRLVRLILKFMGGVDEWVVYQKPGFVVHKHAEMRKSWFKITLSICSWNLKCCIMFTLNFNPREHCLIGIPIPSSVPQTKRWKTVQQRTFPTNHKSRTRDRFGRTCWAYVLSSGRGRVICFHRYSVDSRIITRGKTSNFNMLMTHWESFERYKQLRMCHRRELILKVF